MSILSSETSGILNQFRVIGGVVPPQENFSLSHCAGAIADRKNVKVFCRILFLRMGEIQTIKERYNAEVFIQVCYVSCMRILNMMFFFIQVIISIHMPTLLRKLWLVYGGVS